MGRRIPGRETLRKNIFFQMHFYEKCDLGLQTTFFDGFNMLLSFLAEN